MNIDFKLKLPLINSEGEETTINVISHLMLTPLYALESDVIGPFSSLEDKDFPWIRKLLFNASLTVYRLTKVLEKLNIIDSEELFLLRRDFVICIVTNDIAKQVNKDLASSISRSKSLGDFSVSTSKKGDSAIILRLISDSADCIEEMKKLIEELESSSILPVGFVKGRFNERTLSSDRLWWHTGLSTNIVDGYASKKYRDNNRLYKAGSFNIDSYSKYSNTSLADYYNITSKDREND